MAVIHDLDVQQILSGKQDFQIDMDGAFSAIITVKASNNGAKSVYIQTADTAESDANDLATDVTSTTADVTVTTGGSSGDIAVVQVTRPVKRYLNISSPANTTIVVAKTDLLYIPEDRDNYSQVDLG